MEIIAPRVKKLLTVVAVLAFLGMLVTAYLLYLHYVPEASEFCNFGDQFNCDIVNKSEWSRIEVGPLEIPVAALGFLYYVGIFIGSLGVVKKWRFQKIHGWLRPGKVIDLMRYFTYVGMLFSLYLTYIEAFKLQTYCLFCLIQQGIILVILVLFFVINGLIHRAKKEGKVCEFC